MIIYDMILYYNITAAVRLIGSLYIMIYRVAERAVGWWLGSGRGRPAGGAARRPPRLSPDVFLTFS